MKKAFRITIFVIVFAIAFGCTYHMLSIKDTMGLVGSSISQLNHTPKNTMDVVFVGSSHVYYGITPATLWREHGIAAFDMAISSMDKSSSYHHLKYLLKKQSPKVVMVDLYPMLFDRQMAVGNEYRNMLGMPYSLEAYKMVKDYALPEAQRDFITKFPIIHTRYAEVQKEDFYDSGFAVYGRGERLEYKGGGNADFSVAWSCSDITPISESNLEWLNNICDLADKNNFRLIFYVTPWTTDIESQSILNAVEAYAQEKNIEFLDLSLKSGSIGLDPHADFMDPEHMNVWGAEKTTRWIGDYLLSTQEFTDHRGDTRYSLWEQDTNYREHFMAINAMQHLVDTWQINEALEYLRNIPNLTYIVSLDGTWEDSTLPLSDYLEVLGIPKEAMEAGGIWVGNMGNNTFIMSNEDEGVYYYKFDRYNTARFTKQEGDNLSNVTVGYEKAQYCFDGLSISAYDHINQKLVRIIGLY